LLVDFLKTQRSKEDLKIALDVLREFKGCESNQEFYAIPFDSWDMLENFEAFLAHLVEGSRLPGDFIACLEGINKKP
jgi:hypothetical protein